MSNFRTTQTNGVERVRETLFSSHRTAKAPIAQREPGGSLLMAAVGRAVPDSLVTVRARSRWAGRPAAGRFQASMSRIKIQDPPGSCWCRPARQAGNNECPDHGCESEMGG